MIYELRTYTIRAGMAPIAARNAAEVARPIRGDKHGKLEGYWITEHGRLNQVVHMWSFESLDERARLRADLSANKDWTGIYLPALREYLLRQEVRLMRAILPVKAPTTSGNIYELRHYRTQATRAAEWAKMYTEVMPAREEYSACSGAWICEAGQPNEVCHLWAYPSLDERLQVRSRLGADERWQGFLKQSAPLLEEMNSTVMLPASHSPMQ